ncbi:MAG: DUF1080 domain-containing protein [Pirellulaceae bacterium]|jgi:hypothetical protein|nr:DUF1080 domain-containing protein [Thermoguttaceae bacterium]MDI9443194.1 DUF1080 domain-containing protein [Planctomycetota bacterium]NLZ02838.1 DUF1080 domain-containing protein [Pirellulaceae bacterium]
MSSSTGTFPSGSVLEKKEIHVMWRLGVFFAMLALATLPAPVVRGGAPAGVNATDLSMVDADFAFQGEYAGGVKTPGGQEMRLGAQVIALGAGKFNAVIYAGGLPGDGWTRNDKSAALEGEKHGEAVVLKGDGVSGEIHAEKLTLQHADHPGRAVLETVQRKSPTLGAKPPEGAMVIFDGSGTQMFVEGRINEARLLWAGATTRPLPDSYKLHLEFLSPYMPDARGQGRANSGVYLHDCYEVQVLDSFGLAGKDNECGGIYTVKAPDVNACLPPLAWQTYDFEFTAPKFDTAGKKTLPARLTARHNGILIHDNIPLSHTPGRKGEGPGPRGIHLQAHGNKVQYRNIWLVETK